MVRMASRKSVLHVNSLQCDTYSNRLRSAAAFKRITRIFGFPMPSPHLPTDVWGIQDVVATCAIAVSCLGYAFLIVVLA